MHHFFLSSKFKFKLTYQKLSSRQSEDWLHLTSVWGEEKWGYIRKHPGLEKRMEMMRQMADRTYVLKYAGQPVAMFALHDYENALLNGKIKVKELTHVYIDKSFRGQGIFRQLMCLAKKLAKDEGADLLVLDTLDPNLNRLYERHGAKVVVESKFINEPSELLRIDLRVKG